MAADVPFRSIVSQGDEYLEAELGVGFRLFTERYVSRVTLSRPEHVRAEAANTQLFSSLVNEWRFLPGPEPGTTWLEFRVDFAFKSALYAQASAMFLDEVARRMVSAFEARCDELYGPGAGGASSARLAARERSEREQSQAGDGGSEGGSDGTTEGGAGRGAGAQEEAKEAAGGAVGAAPPSTPGGRPSVARQTAPARPSQGSGLGGSGGVAISSGLSVLRPRRAHRPPPLPDKGSSLW